MPEPGCPPAVTHWVSKGEEVPWPLLLRGQSTGTWWQSRRLARRLVIIIVIIIELRHQHAAIYPWESHRAPRCHCLLLVSITLVPPVTTTAPGAGHATARVHMENVPHGATTSSQAQRAWREWTEHPSCRDMSRWEQRWQLPGGLGERVGTHRHCASSGGTCGSPPPPSWGYPVPEVRLTPAIIQAMLRPPNSCHR